MTDEQIVIELDDEDVEGHRAQGVIEGDDTGWLKDKLRSGGGRPSFRVQLDEEDDTEGHIGGGGPTVKVILGDEDDTEGHAIAIHFPSRAEADAFRKRLMVTGVLVGTVALGAAGGVGLSALQSDSGTGAGAGTTQSQAYENYREAAANEGARQGAAAAADAQAYANYQEAAANEGARQGGGSAAAQVGPLDVHEAPAFQSAASATDADRDIGIMDGSNAAAPTQVGPLDAHEAPAFQDAGLSAADQAYADRLSGQQTQVGPMDVHEAPAFQQSTTDEGSSELNDIGGPTPR